MKPRSYSSEGIVIQKNNSKESDRMFTILSQKYGKQRFLARGVRKIKSRKRGHLEVFSHIKFSASMVPGLDILTEVESINDYPQIRKNLHKMSLAFYFCEVTNKILREGERHENVFELLKTYLKRLEKETKLKDLRLLFIHDLLINLGFWSEDKKLLEADSILDDVLERKLTSFEIGKQVLQ